MLAVGAYETACTLSSTSCSAGTITLCALREPQSKQSVPLMHDEYSEPAPPSSQRLSCECLHEFSQTCGSSGGAGGGNGDGGGNGGGGVGGGGIGGFVGGGGVAGGGGGGCFGGTAGGGKGSCSMGGAGGVRRLALTEMLASGGSGGGSNGAGLNGGDGGDDGGGGGGEAVQMPHVSGQRATTSWCFHTGVLKGLQ